MSEEQGRQDGPQAGAPATDAAPAKKPVPRKKIVLTVLCVLLALVLVAAVAAAVLYHGIASELDGEKTQAGTLSDEVKTAEIYPEYTGKDIVNILVCGLDYPEPDELPEGVTLDDEKQKSDDPLSGGAKVIGNPDMILYVSYDTTNNKASILQIPRDTFVGPDLATGGTGKINGLYLNSPDPDNRVNALASCISTQLDLPVDHYITIHMDSVKEIIDISGTIRVYVPMEVNDPRDPDAVIPQGWRDFTSTEAEWFLRNRKSTTYKQQGDIMRLQMQQSFYSALFREFKSLAPSDLLMWMRVLLYRVTTDIDPMQAGGLAQKALALEGEDITFVRPAVTGADYGAYSLVCLEPESTAELLNAYFRPEGQARSAEALDIQTLPVNYIGLAEANVRTMGDLQRIEEEGAASTPQSEATAE